MTRFPLRVVLLVALLFCACLAQADVMFALGNNPQSNEQSVNFTVGSSGHTIQGTTSNPAFDVSLYSKDDPLRVHALGSSFAIQTAHDDGNNDTSINDVLISVANGTFQDLIGSVYGVFAQNPWIDISVWTTDSKSPFTFSFQGDLANHGNEDNFFTISTSNNEQITEVLITGKFFQLDDLSLSGLKSLSSPGVVGTPEPGSMILLGGGFLAGLTFLRRKR